MRKLLAEGRVEQLPDGNFRMAFWTDEEIDQMNQLALLKRAELPIHARAFYATWEQMFNDIDDGRRWRGVQSASRPNKGVGYSSIRQMPSVMNFA